MGALVVAAEGACHIPASSSPTDSRQELDANLITPSSPATASRQELDDVLAEMARGRHWHAARLLRARFPEGSRGGRPELTLLLAEAEAGWGNWPEVRGLLEGPLALGTIRDASAWLLLGRSFEEAGGWAAAEGAYTRALAGAEEERTLTAQDVVARRALVRARMGRVAEATNDVEQLLREDPALGGWVALEVAEAAAEAGSRGETRSLLGMIMDVEVRALGWELPARALLAAGDPVGAEAAYWLAIPSLTSSLERAVAWERSGALRLARGDSAGARGAFHRALELSEGAPGVSAARALLALGFDSVGVALRGAQTLAGAGLHREALEAFRAHERLLGGAPEAVETRLARARAHAGLGEWQQVLTAVRSGWDSEDAVVGVPSLVLGAQALRGLGRGAEARTAEDLLVASFPQGPEAVEILFRRADALRGSGNLQGALRGFRETAELAPPQNLAGEARMRVGQILLSLGREQEASEVFSRYLEMFPAGRRWDEAAFWAGRTLRSLGRVEEGDELLRDLVARFPVSYYALRGGELLGRPFGPDIPPDPRVGSLAPHPLLEGGLAAVDRLDSLGLRVRSRWEVDRLAAMLRREEDLVAREVGLLRLALELGRRGYTREGINLGWELRREGAPWSRELLSAVYPFPHRELVEAQSRERGLDPFLVAGLIRQESAFWVEARSRADARGLMQLLPGTGAEVARWAGPRDFRADRHLYLPEINVHLGTAFLADLRRRFGGDLPIVLSAYNAGPSRALRWREIPEVRDPPRFVELIPFTETRGYVKAVLLNQELYRWLYGPAIPGSHEAPRGADRPTPPSQNPPAGPRGKRHTTEEASD
jgi:soluble lytic murein transglycosylase